MARACPADPGRQKAPGLLPPDPSTECAGSGGEGLGGVPPPTEYGIEFGQDLDHAGYADFVGYGEFKSLREIAVPQGEPRRPSSGGPWRFSATSRRSRQTCSAMNMAKMRPNMAKMEPKMAKMGHKMAKMRSQMAKTPLSR